MESSLSELLFAGIRLMFIGMTIVFLFLALLVWVIGVSSRLLNRYSPEEPESMAAALGSRRGAEMMTISLPSSPQLSIAIWASNHHKPFQAFKEELVRCPSPWV